jgi:uncharacterized protein YjbI with pentapeptide repeats
MTTPGSRMRPYANLEGTDLSTIIATGASFYSANLKGVDLRGADLTRTNWRLTTLTGATLDKADLTGARNLKPSQLAEARSLHEATIDGALRQELEEQHPKLIESLNESED